MIHDITGALLQLLLPHLSQVQLEPLLRLTSQHLSTLVCDCPATLEVLLPWMKEMRLALPDLLLSEPEVSEAVLVETPEEQDGGLLAALVDKEGPELEVRVAASNKS